MKNSQSELEIPETMEEVHPLELSSVQMKNIGLTTDSIQERPLRNLLKLNGFLGIPPHSEALITSIVEAQVVNIRARPFHVISKNETLIEISGQSILDLQQKFFEFKSQLKFTEKEYLRKQKLHEAGTIADQEFEMSEREYNQLTASGAGLAGKLKLLGFDPGQMKIENITPRIQIRSPLNGSVERIFTRINEYVHPGDPLVRIVSLEDMHVELEVFERDLLSIEIGMQVEFWLLDQESQHHQATIEQISKEVDPRRRTVTAHAHLNRLVPGLRPGNYVEARVILDEERVMSLPDDSFVNDQGLTYIFKMGENDGSHTHFEKVPVITTVSDGGYTSFTPVDEISLEGMFVVQGAYFLMAQSRINEGQGGGDH